MEKHFNLKILQKTENYIIDVEANGLLAELVDFSSFPYKLKPDAKIWCVVIRNHETGETHVAEKEHITEDFMRNVLTDCKRLIAHNGIKYDFLLLKLFGVLDYTVGYLNEPDTLFGEEVKLLDTLILSRLGNPSRSTGHSLSNWGGHLGEYKNDFRQTCIDKGVIDNNSKKGSEFKQFCKEMVDYCDQDTLINGKVFDSLKEEFKGQNWKQSIKLENKLADIGIKRECLGFYFDKKSAIKFVEDLDNKIEDLKKQVSPHLPPRKANKGELKEFTPPEKQQKKDGSLNAYMYRFCENIGADITNVGEDTYMIYQGVDYKLPFHKPIKTEIKAGIEDLDHVKQYLISLGWEPSEWNYRDLTKDSAKKLMPFKKRREALERWYGDTINGKYKESRLKELGLKEEDVLQELGGKIEENYPVNVPTSPPVRVGVTKEICPNIIALGDKAHFAEKFALYLTYKHRKSTIAGGDLEGLDLTKDKPKKGYLSMYREIDGRVPTPSIEIGAISNRYTHIGVANVPRPSSIYGKEMRGLFGSGEEGVQLGYDFSSLENRIMGHYVYRYPHGKELAKDMIAEKPNDLHSKNAKKLGIDRTTVKSLTYALLYGAQIPKIAAMLNLDTKEATKLYNEYWDSVPALRNLKEKIEGFWEKNGRYFIPAIDGRKIMTRSKHSLLNSVFQSAGVIAAKYVNVTSMQYIEKAGYNTDPFVRKPDVCSMIEYHDECQLFIDKSIVETKTFSSKEEAEKFSKNWQGENELSVVSEGKKWYVCLPNIVSQSVEKAMKETENTLSLNIPLGYEWVVGRSWKDCH